MDLGLDDEMLNACVQCGLCLTACPTYQVTADETRSPRGRIKLMREVQDNDAPVTPEVVDAFASCVQCRACEPACPSDVQFGHLMEQTRATLVAADRMPAALVRVAFAPLARPWVLRAGSSALGLLQRVVPLPSRLGLPRRIPVRRERLTASGGDVVLFTGCVMDAWQRDVHAATIRVLEAAGLGVTPSGDAAACCGALHTHAGLADRARELARRTIEALPPDVPVLVDSAGCGAAMKEYGHLLGTTQAERFAERVRDVHEFLVDHLDALPTVEPVVARVAVQDPCHLRHVQRAHGAVRAVLAPFVTDLVELDDDGLCCGAGGAYAVVQRDLALDVRDRKLAAITRAAPDLVASANPGCQVHLDAAGVRAVHPMTIVDRALRGHRLARRD